jgi:hypothetical protein
VLDCVWLFGKIVNVFADIQTIVCYFSDFLENCFYIPKQFSFRFEFFKNYIHVAIVLEKHVAEYVVHVSEFVYRRRHNCIIGLCVVI